MNNPNPIDLPLTQEQIDAFVTQVKTELTKSVKLAEENKKLRAYQLMCINLYNRHFFPREWTNVWYKREAQSELEKLLKEMGDIK